MRASAEGNSDSGMSFWEHLDVLRGVLIRAAVLLLIVTIGMFCLMPQIFDSVILAPCNQQFPVYSFLNHIQSADILGLSSTEFEQDFNIELININLASQFMIHMSLSFWLALVLSAPALMFLLWQFVSPGLYKRERKPITIGLTFGTVMFYLGVAVSYFIVFPLTLRFLSGYQLSSEIPNIISIQSYMDTLINLSLLLGLAFELPLVAMILGRFRLLTRNFFARYRRHAIVALLVLAAVITPTGDPFTLLVVFIPLYLLWESSALLVPRGAKELVMTELS